MRCATRRSAMLRWIQLTGDAKRCTSEPGSRYLCSIQIGHTNRPYDINFVCVLCIDLPGLMHRSRKVRLFLIAFITLIRTVKETPSLLRRSKNCWTNTQIAGIRFHSGGRWIRFSCFLHFALDEVIVFNKERVVGYPQLSPQFERSLRSSCPLCKY
jgi:hypothetical protein